MCACVTLGVGCVLERAGILVSIDFIVSVAAANVGVVVAAVILNSLCQSNKREKLFANCSVLRTAPSLPPSLSFCRRSCC